jgi:hypothetical protein
VDLLRRWLVEPVSTIQRPMGILIGALLGGAIGFCVGFLISDHFCSVAVYNCYPTEELKVGLSTAAGIGVGLFAWRLRRHVTKLMGVAVVILLVLLVVACFHRVNHWSCPPDAFCAPYSGAT